MDTRAEDPFHQRPEAWIAVKILPEIRAWLLGVDEADFNAPGQKAVEHAQEGDHFSAAGFGDIHVLDVGGGDPEPFSRLRDEAADDLGVYFVVGNELIHDVFLCFLSKAKSMPVPVKATAWQKPSATVHKINTNGKKSTRRKRKNFVLGIYYTDGGEKLILALYLLNVCGTQ